MHAYNHLDNDWHDDLRTLERDTPIMASERGQALQQHCFLQGRRMATHSNRTNLSVRDNTQCPSILLQGYQRAAGLNVVLSEMFALGPSAPLIRF